MRMEKHLTKLEGFIGGTPIYKYEDTEDGLYYDLHLPDGTKFYINTFKHLFSPCIAKVIIGNGQSVRCLRLGAIKCMYILCKDNEWRRIDTVFDIIQSTEYLSDLYCIPKKGVDATK